MAFSLLMIVLGFVFYKKLGKTVKQYVLLAAGIWGTLFFIAAFHGFYDSEAGLIVRTYLGPLESFQIDRIYWLNPTLWYLELTLSCIILFGIAEYIFTKLIVGIKLLKEKINDIKHLLLVCLHGFFPTVLIHFQGDDGTALVFAVMALGMMYAAGLKLRYFVAALSAALVATPFLYFFVLNDDQRTRIWNIFNIEADIQGAGYQQYRGRVAIANGGWFGQGFLKGTLTQTAGVPEGHNDFIFVSIGEEFGFLGCIVVVLLLAAISLRCLYIGKQCYKKSGTFMCAGMFSMLLAHIIINIGMCCSVLPVIGITLPFFSAGGTSLLCLYLGVGLILSVYMHRNSRTIYLRD